MIESLAQASPADRRSRVANDNADAPWPVVAFSLAELSHLVRTGILEPAPSSPVGTLLEGAPRADLDSRSVSASLSEKGLMNGASREPSSDLGAFLLLALKVLARPRARLVLARYSPEGEPSVLPLFLRGELAVPAFLDDAGLHVGMPMERAALSKTLEEQLGSEEPPTLGDRLLMPTSVLETIEGLWCATGRSYSQPIPKAVALEVLAHLPDSEAEPEARLAELTGSGLAGETADGFRFTKEARPWMERVLSGHSCELSFVPLDASAGEPGRPLRLLFLGSAGRRILCSGVEGLDDLEAVLKHGQDHAIVPGPWTSLPADTPESTLALSVLPRSVLRWYLRRLLQG